MREPEPLCVLPIELTNQVFPCEWTMFTPESYGSVLNDERVYFMDRDQAEINWNYKQLVAYIVFRYRGKLILVKRVNEGERRLEGKMGCVGGHVNVLDAFVGDNMDVSWDMCRRAAAREYHEECNQWRNYAPEITWEDFNIIGIINSYRSEVDSVHLGVVMELGVEYYLEHPQKLSNIYQPHALLPENQYGKPFCEDWVTILAQHYGD